MTRKLTVELPEDLHESARHAAERAGLPLEKWLIRQVEFAAPTPEMSRASRERFMKFAGKGTPVEPSERRSQLDQASAD